jgi:cell division protein FtsB
MKLLTIVLIILLATLQYKLWFAKGGIPDVFSLKDRYENQIAKNDRLTERNKALLAEINNLKEGKAAIEERARSELGMIKEDEVFYQIIEKGA